MSRVDDWTKRAHGLTLGADKVALYVEDPGGRAQAMATCAVARAEAGDVRMANYLIDTELARDAPMPSSAVVWMARALALTGQHDRARSMADDGHDPAVSAAALAAVAASMARAGACERALALARSMPDPDRRKWALATVAVALARAGDVPAAMSLIGEAVPAFDVTS
jgi:hypothetical protein